MPYLHLAFFGFLICVPVAVADVAEIRKSVSIEAGAATQPQPVPRFTGGLLVRYNADWTEIQRWDNQGRRLAAVPLAVPGVERIAPKDIAISPSGVMAVAATVLGPDRQTASIILWFSARGQLEKVVRTSPFSARRLTFASNGELWAAGRVHDGSYRELPEHDVIRRYGENGELIGSSLPRTTFAPDRANHPAAECFLFTKPGGVGFLSVASREFVELALDGTVTRRTVVPPLRPEQVLSGAAYTEGGDLIVSIHTGVTREQAALGAGARNQSQLQRLDRNSGSFIDVDLTAVRNTEQGVSLLGREGGSLIVRRNPGDSLLWLALH
jgi:hypothetical protein